MLIALFKAMSRAAEPCVPDDGRGPVPLDPQLLHEVVGGFGDDGSPKGRWSPIEPTNEDDIASPKGRW